MKLFVSYSRVDKPFCAELVELLESHEVWWDQKILGGDLWWKRILEKLEWCDGFIFLLSNDSVNSDYCIKEYNIARENGKQIFPLLIRIRTDIPQSLESIKEHQFINCENGIDVRGIASLFNALTEKERELRTKTQKPELSLKGLDLKSPNVEDNSVITKQLPAFANMKFNYIINVAQREYSKQTEHMYSLWICRFLEDTGGHEPISINERDGVLNSLPLELLNDCLHPAQVKVWYGMLAAKGVDRQAIKQARSALMSLASLLEEDGLITSHLMHKLRTVNIPGSISKTERTFLTEDQLRKVLIFDEKISPTTNSFYRDRMIVSMLCILKVSELALAKWDHIIEEGDELYIHVPQKNEEILLPKFCVDALLIWKEHLMEITDLVHLNSTFIARRIMRGGRIDESGISPRAFPQIVDRITFGLDVDDVIITPDELRLSFQHYRENVSLRADFDDLTEK